jgi:hypothetical protein
MNLCSPSSLASGRHNFSTSDVGKDNNNNNNEYVYKYVFWLTLNVHKSLEGL